MKNRRILLIEDDDTIAYGLTELLLDEGFETVPVRFLKEALEAEPGDFCLALLDLGLPDGEGWDFLARLCPVSAAEMGGLQKGLALPVIILTAREDEADIMRGLDMGADDYVTKPFRPGVLLSRIRAVLRRQEKFSGAEEVISCGGLVLDRQKTTVTEGGERIELTAGEFRLLSCFMENKNRTLTRNALLARLWDNEGDFVNDNTLTVTVRRLREKLGEESRNLIKTVRGIGYRMEDCDD